MKVKNSFSGGGLELPGQHLQPITTQPNEGIFMQKEYNTQHQRLSTVAVL